MKHALGCLAWMMALAAGVGPGSAGASREYRVAIVRHGPPGLNQPQINGLRAGLEELRYNEGGNLVLDFLDDENLPLLRDRLRAELKRGDTDLIISLGTVETAVAREVAGKMLILFMPATDPVESGFVASLATPRTNLTGLTYFIDSEGVGKQLEVFKQVVPSLRYVTALTDGRRDGGMNDRLRARLRSAGMRLGIGLSEAPVSSTAAAADVLSVSRRVGLGIFVVCTGLFRNLSDLAMAAIRLRVPLFGCSAAQVAEQKVLMTYAPDLYAIGYRGAWYVDRILRGTPPQVIAVETPRKFDLVTNRTAAQEIRLKLPPEMLMLADRVLD